MHRSKGKIVLVVGARPQFIKAAVLARRLRRPDAPPLETVLVHTGQHYDANMSELFFKQLGLPDPDYRLDVGSASAARQTALVLERLEPVLQREAPDAVVVFGDTNSTLAAALCAAQCDVPVVHVEAGERLYRRRRMPEEVNRVVADHLARLCLAATERAATCLRREGVAEARVRVTGDLHYDLFLWGVEQRAARQTTARGLGLEPGKYILATLHRAENTDDGARLIELLRALDAAPDPVLLPMHPRLKRRMSELDYVPSGSLRPIDAVGYIDLIGLLEDSRLVVTDSGGLLRESYFARKPSLAPMERHCWDELAWSGWSLPVGGDCARLARLMAEGWTCGQYVEGLFGDGHAAERIVDAITQLLDEDKASEPWTIYGDARETLALAQAQARDRFTFEAWHAMLADLKREGRVFAVFEDAKALLDRGEQKFVLLRHDVDMDLEAALAMAREDARAEVRATFFLMVGNPFYDLMDPANRRRVEQILELGHHLGLHFDAGVHAGQSNDAVIAADCRRRAEWLEQWFSRPVRIVSLHRPDARALADGGSLTAPLPHAYLPLYRERMLYLSDSGGQWNHGYPSDAATLAQDRPLHVLAHPIWHGAMPSSPLESLECFVERRTRALRRQLAENCRPYRLGDWWAAPQPPDGGQEQA